MNSISRRILGCVVVGCLFAGVVSCDSGDEREGDTWRVYKADAASSSYSSLAQINKDNVGQLEIAWTFDPADALPGMRLGKYECNPIIIDTLLYATSARRHVYAIDARTGEKVWSFDPFQGERGGGNCRGVTYWESGSDKRILFTADHYLYAVNALTGEAIATFGENGRVDLNKNLDTDKEGVWVIPTSPGIIWKDLFIIGGEVSELYDAAPGHIRAYDVRTGERKWIFHTIPHPGEEGYDTWPPDAWKYAGGANNWGGMSLDEKRGIVYAPLGSPTYDFYGADRKGQNLFGNSLVALDANTGKLLWYFQTVHHDLWDYDLPAPANLVTIRRSGKTIDAVALISKTAFLYVFDRVTGEPVFPIEERAVPPSRIPGEEAWPTQPFPLHPAPYARQEMTEGEINDLTPAFRDSIVHALSSLRYEGLFTPPDPKGTLMLPGTRGGAEWGGAAYDPESSVLYINANESPEVARVERVRKSAPKDNQSTYERGRAFYYQNCASCHGPDRAGQEPLYPSLLGVPDRLSKAQVLTVIENGSGRMPAFAPFLEGNRDAIIAFLFDIKTESSPSNSIAVEEDTTTHYFNTTAYGHFSGPSRKPAIKPPWGTLNAIDLNTGEYLWRRPLGNYPDLQAPGAPETGMENWGGPMVTGGGLVFIAATRDNKFRAFDKKTGDVLWETELPGPGYATPATYSCGGRQYVVIAVSGNREDPSGKIIAFALPESIR
ncbi:MAG: PQQ-binding-like beta-propeller repeat protein [Bacteroidota bacterium]|jgi:quinoprotein glucose dehydrogenase|nr:MAG: pyrroloquinoline quinone-dependent dehydrogenase [Bacteroidota bacterium]